MQAHLPYPAAAQPACQSGRRADFLAQKFGAPTLLEEGRPRRALTSHLEQAAQLVEECTATRERAGRQANAIRLEALDEVCAPAS